MRTRATLFAMLAVLIAAALPLPAQESGGRPQEPFTAAELERFVDDWPALAQWAKQTGNPLDILGAQSVEQAMDRFLQDRGWEPERFFYVAGHAMAALLVMDLSEQTPAIIARLEQQKTLIERDSRLSREQKERALADTDEAILEVMQFRTGHDVPEQELELVRARREEVKEAFRLGRAGR
jgi:hypothetical protein